MTVARADPLGAVQRLTRRAERRPRCWSCRAATRCRRSTLPGSRRYQPGGVALAGPSATPRSSLAARLPPRRSAAAHPLAKLGAHRRARRAGVPRRVLRAPRAGARHLRRRRATRRFEEAVSIAASFACTAGTQDSLLDLLFAGPEAYAVTAAAASATSNGCWKSWPRATVSVTGPSRPGPAGPGAAGRVRAARSASCWGWDAARRELVDIAALAVPRWSAGDHPRSPTESPTRPPRPPSPPGGRPGRRGAWAPDVSADCRSAWSASGSCSGAGRPVSAVGVAMVLALEARAFVARAGTLRARTQSRLRCQHRAARAVGIYQVITDDATRAGTGIIQRLPLGVFPLVAAQC